MPTRRPSGVDHTTTGDQLTTLEQRPRNDATHYGRKTIETA
jgi:hypothetical protein